MFVTKQQAKNKTNVVTDFSRCLICQKYSSEILNNLTKRGLPRFREAMLEHNDEEYERLRHDIPDDDQFLLKKNSVPSRMPDRVHTQETFKFPGQVPKIRHKRSGNIATVDYKTRCFPVQKRV